MELLLTVVQEHQKLQKENRILQKQLERSETNRVRLEIDNEKKEFLLRRVIRELSESKQTLQFKSDRLEKTAIELQQVQVEIERARQIADAANQAKSEFLANMSHELRTPLNGILGYAQILGRADLPAKEQHGIDIIHQCGSHLLSLIDDVLDLAKIEARKLDLDPQSIDLRAFLQGVTEICQIRAEQKKIDFICQFDPLLPTGVVTDPKRLRQVLINLLGNAVKFTDLGSVTFGVKLLEARSDPALAQICFEIVDTGVGIATDAIPQIFRSFEQVGEKQRQSAGTGLGLTISQNIVQLMGDEIQVKSQLGVGSVFAFTLELPLAHNWAQQQLVDRHERNIIGYEGRSRHVLEAESSPYRPIRENLDCLRLIPPSAADLQILLELAQAGMLKKLAATAAQIGRQNDLYQPFVDRLLEFTKHFQVERAEEFIQTYVSRQGD